MTDEPTIEGWGVLEHAVELGRRGEQFALATVIWREAPSSGQQGSRAIVTASGQVHGWIGGACAEPVLIREALGAIADRAPRLLALGDSDKLTDAPDDVTRIAFSCQSDGALQIFIEPFISMPHLVIVGRSPMARTLLQLARSLDWNAELVDAAGFGPERATARSLVVVATQGHGDEEVLEQALGVSPAYLGVVASPRRGDALRGYLADRGVGRDVLDSIRIPIGLDLGPTTHREVAVAVLAELVQLRAAGEFEVSDESESAVAAPEAIDPVCGMTVVADDRSHSLVIDGTAFYFCCVACRDRFEAEEKERLAGGAPC